jgi:MFS transporter, MHS family, citrate/tricarballylate:H+ symporter
VYLAEIATPGHRGFYCAWQSASQQVAVIFASLLGVLVNSLIPAEQMAAWGWRIPVLIGCLIIPLILIFRRSLKETEEFAPRKRHPTTGEVLRIIGENWSVVLSGVLLSSLTTTTFYLITAYTPTFGKTVLHFTDIQNLSVRSASASPTCFGCRWAGRCRIGSGAARCCLRSPRRQSSPPTR